VGVKSVHEKEKIEEEVVEKVTEVMTKKQARTTGNTRNITS